MHEHWEPRETTGKALKRPSQEGHHDLLGIREPVGINQVTETSVMKSAICEERQRRGERRACAIDQKESDLQ